MIEQVASPSGRAAFLYGLNKTGFIFQQPVNRFLDHLRGILTRARGKPVRVAN